MTAAPSEPDPRLRAEPPLAFPPGRWRARWIWAEPSTAPGGMPAPRHTVALRTELDLDSVPASVPARLVSVSRHVLFVNGQAVARGPVRSNPRRQPYDDVDLAPHLRPGRNVIGAIVTRYGGPMPWYLPAPELSNDLVQGAFVLEADLGGGRWLVTDDSWTGTVLDGWTAGPPSGIAGRSIELVDGRSLPGSWLDEDPAWPAVLCRRAMTAGEPGRSEPPSYPYGPFGPRPTTWPATVVLPLADEGDGARGTDRVSIGTLVADVEGPVGATVTVRAAEFATQPVGPRRTSTTWG